MKKKSSKNVIAAIATVVVITAVIVMAVVMTQPKTKNPEKCNHTFEKVEEKTASEFSPGVVKYRCTNCKEEKKELLNATGKLPQLYLDGTTDGIGKDSEVFVKADYIDGKDSFQSNSTIKYQGHTSMNYDKKNYTIKFFEDEKGEDKNKVSVHGWKKSSKYCLKANYIDFSQSRNIVSANIWTDVVGTRKNIDKNIAELQNYGAIDGYPIMLFINNKYQGTYTMNIPKDDDTYEIGDDENEALFVINSPNSKSSYFKAKLTENDKKEIYDLEYCGGDDDSWAYNSLDNLIDFVIKNDGEKFRKGADKYLDVESAIDYLVTTYYLGLTDNFAKNALLLTYNGDKWILSMYDMDTAFGLAFDGSGIYKPDYLLPKKTAKGKLDSASDSLLWDRILNNYSKEIKSRYFELRKNVLKNENVLKRFETFINGIPKNYYEKDLELWGDIPLHKENNINQIKDFMNKRSKLLDEFFGGI